MSSAVGWRGTRERERARRGSEREERLQREGGAALAAQPTTAQRSAATPLFIPCLARSPSGSGKSTLLDTLSGRKTVGTLEVRCCARCDHLLARRALPLAARRSPRRRSGATPAAAPRAPPPAQGAIAYGGNTPTPQFLRRFTGYVEQFDTLLDSLTVREMLMCGRGWGLASDAFLPAMHVAPCRHPRAPQAPAPPTCCCSQRPPIGTP